MGLFVICSFAMSADRGARGDTLALMELIAMGAGRRLTPRANCATIGDTIGGMP